MELINRNKHLKKIEKLLEYFPIVGIIGARQVGKTTLAKQLAQNKNSVYFDLEDDQDQAKLTEPRLLFDYYKDKLIILDEIQFMPKLFNVLRTYVDKFPNRRFLVLGSASPSLIRESSETLAGRIAYFKLNSFSFDEISHNYNLETYLLKGGFPKSLLIEDFQISWEWRKNFIDTFLFRDTRKFGFKYPPETLKKFLKFLSFNVGQTVNYSNFATNFGISHTTVKRYLDYLQGTYFVYSIEPFLPNIKKRLVKTPKIYFSDVGILNFLLNIENFENLISHPLFGFIWENLVFQQIISNNNIQNLYFFRTSTGAEIDFIIEKGQNIIAVECKTSFSPKLTKGFWSALDIIKPEKTFVVIPKDKEFYPLKQNIFVVGLLDFIENLNN